MFEQGYWQCNSDHEFHRKHNKDLKPNIDIYNYILCISVFNGKRFNDAHLPELESEH